MRPLTWMLLVLAAALPLAGGAATMVLDHDGRLFRLITTDDQLAVEINGDDESTLLLVPQTTGLQATNLNLVVDEAHDILITAWEEQVDDQLSRVQLATYRDGTWWGPVVIAGEEWVTAGNPEMLLHTVSSTVENPDGTTSEIATSFLHLAWWVDLHAENGGYAVYRAVELTPEGIPVLEGSEPMIIMDLSPWGLVCTATDEARTLAHPKLFLDPQTGDPHLLVASLTDCLFAILQLQTELVVDDETEIQRRRHVVILGRTREIAIAPGLRLENAAIEVGHGMSVVAHWDDEDEVRYVSMNEEGWSQVRSLQLGPDLDHERAVALIRGLTR